MPHKTIPQSPFNIRIAYGQALEEAGLNAAIQLIDQLLDDGYQEKFVEYFPGQTSFKRFLERFKATRKRVLDSLGWEYDNDLLAKNPTRTTTIRDYFDKTFKPAILIQEQDDE